MCKTGVPYFCTIMGQVPFQFCFLSHLQAYQYPNHKDYRILCLVIASYVVYTVAR
jgi:hypothetical protein